MPSSQMKISVVYIGDEGLVDRTELNREIRADLTRILRKYELRVYDLNFTHSEEKVLTTLEDFAH